MSEILYHIVNREKYNLTLVRLLVHYKEGDVVIRTIAGTAFARPMSHHNVQTLKQKYV